MGDLGDVRFWHKALRNRSFQPTLRFHRVAIAGSPVCEIPAEHHLSLAMTKLRGGAEPALGGPPIRRKIMAAAMERTERKHRAAMSCGRRFLEKLQSGSRVAGPAPAVRHHLGKCHLRIRYACFSCS